MEKTRRRHPLMTSTCHIFTNRHVHSHIHIHLHTAHAYRFEAMLRDKSR